MRYDDLSTLPIKDVMARFGAQLERYRLSRNLRQEDVARAAGVSRMTVSKLESGGGTLETLVRVLRALDIEERLLQLVPDATLSPLDPRSGQAAGRQRARPVAAPTADQPWTWGDES